jgi:hypothetical protein
MTRTILLMGMEARQRAAVGNREPWPRAPALEIAVPGEKRQIATLSTAVQDAGAPAGAPPNSARSWTAAAQLAELPLSNASAGR